MKLDPDTCYQSLLSRDCRFDGWFFVAVSSTGIYCRVVCPVKSPKRQNCSFFTTAANAEKAGYRPCLRCRPELAPGNGLLDFSGNLARAAAGLIIDGFLNAGTLSDLAVRVGVTERHLRRIFMVEFNVTMVEFAQTQRLLLAKRLLTDSSLPVTDIALAAGFGSVRRFNDVFVAQYRMTPSRLRKGIAVDASGASENAARLANRCDKTDRDHKGVADNSDVLPHVREESRHPLRFQLAYRPPFSWSGVLAFLAHRQIAGVESIVDDTYNKSLRVTHRDTPYVGWISVKDLPKRLAIEVTLSPSLAPVVGTVLRRMTRMFDLDAQPDLIDAALGPLAQDLPGMRVPGAFDGFEIAARAIVGQQVSVARARTVLGKIAQAYGNSLGNSLGSTVPDDTPDGLLRTFPGAAILTSASVESLVQAGLIRTRAQALIDVAQQVASQHILLEPMAPLRETLDALRAIRGVGEWTVQYIAMRALCWPNAFPAGDAVLKRQLGLADHRAVLDHAERWAPWRAYATLHLWRGAQALENL